MKTPPPLPLAKGQTPLPWQVAAVDAIRREVHAGRRSILTSAATGTGKGSLVAGLIVLCARAGKRCLFIVHMDELIDDVMERALAAESRLYSGKVKGPQNEIDRQCVFASAQTLQGERLKDIGHFDYLFFDEAHFSATPTWTAIRKRVLEVNPAAITLGFTATPFRTGSSGGTKGLGATFEVVASQYTLEDGIRDGVLSPLVCRAVETQLDLTGVDPDDEKKLAKLVDTPERNAKVVDVWFGERPGKPTIMFCASIAHAKHLAEAFTARGVAASWTSGEDPQRKEKIRAFKNGHTTVMCNQNLLTTGFDYRALEVVGLVRPTKSLLMLFQMVGRGTRVFPGKESGLILDYVSSTTAGLGFVGIADLSTPPPSVRITVGCIVRHRRDEALPEGTVVGLRDEEQADVIWAGRSEADGVYPCRDLVLLRPARVPDTLVLEPNVIGTSTFTVILFGKDAGRVVGWYQRDSKTYGKVYVTKGKDEAALLIPTAPKSHTWEYWHLAKRWGEKSTATLRHIGHFHECKDRAEAVIDRPQDWNKDWLGDPATEKQLKALHKTGQKLSKGEASMLLEIKYGLMAVKDARKIVAWGGASASTVPA